MLAGERSGLLIKVLKDKKILLCVTGGIAAYKACSLVGYFVKNGADVKVIMSKAATEFVGPLTFQALTNHAVYIDMFEIINKEEVEHISLATWCDVAVIAPATANTIGKIAGGIADNLLTTVIAALPQKKKVVIAPAMNKEMWNNPITQDNIKKLKKYSRYIFVEPRKGMLACRVEGAGKIADTETIVETVKKALK